MKKSDLEVKPEDPVKRRKFMNVLVTGIAGFIGFHVGKALLEKGYRVVGIDNLNPYYDPSLKEARLKQIEDHEKFQFFKVDLSDFESLLEISKDTNVEIICNLAAQAGVRYSLVDPFSYGKSNLMGFLNILEVARRLNVKNLVYASSSSVYGKNTQLPYSVDQRVDSPVSIYAATKRSNELMAFSYHHLYGIPCTGLRYFTVYGPWGRPDMALFLFVDAMLKGQTIKVYNYGNMRRDFTYIDDIVEGTVAAIERPMGYEILNLGNSNSVNLMDFIKIIEEELGIEAKKEFLPLQPGDVIETKADITRSQELLGFSPKVDLRTGIQRFLAWYKEYYGF